MLERLASAVVVALVLWGLGAAPAHAEPTPAEVTQLTLERTDEGVLLSATLHFDLPAVIDDALAKGIPMFFVAEAALYRDRWYWTDKRVANAQRYMRLAFQPLTRRWRLQVSATPVGNSGPALGQTFDTREEALAAVQRISRWRIADAADVDPEAAHNVEFRFRLDITQLPRPFQIGAVGHADWTISASRNQRLLLDAR